MNGRHGMKKALLGLAPALAVVSSAAFAQAAPASSR